MTSISAPTSSPSVDSALHTDLNALLGQALHAVAAVAPQVPATARAAFAELRQDLGSFPSNIGLVLRGLDPTQRALLLEEVDGVRSTMAQIGGSNPTTLEFEQRFATHALRNLGFSDTCRGLAVEFERALAHFRTE